jgi:hypothetical protein
MGGVEALVTGIGCFEVRGQAVTVAAFCSVPEQCRAEPTALLGHVDADQGEVPMAFGGMEVAPVPAANAFPASAVTNGGQYVR